MIPLLFSRLRYVIPALLCLLVTQTAFGLVRHPDMTDAQALALGDLPQFKARATVSSRGCSAAMLNSEWAVFAAHCYTINGVQQDEYRVSVIYYVDGVAKTEFGTAYIVRSGDPGYDDVALIHLDNPIPEAVSWVTPYDRFDEYEQLGWQVGRGQYGAAGSTINNSDGQTRAATQRIISANRESINGVGASVVPQFLHFRFDGSPVGSTNPQTTRYEGSTAPGDSGGSMFVYSRGRFFTASVVSGFDPAPFSDFRNSRLSTHLGPIIERSALDFAYPQALIPEAIWVAEDLNPALSDLATVNSWSDRLGLFSWSSTSDGGSGAPTFVEAATPTGLSAVRFDGDDQMGLSAGENPLAGKTSLSVAMVVRTAVAGSGFQTDAFGTKGILDASSGGAGWGLSYSRNDRMGWSIEAQDSSVTGIFRGGAGNTSLSDNQWHVVVATWDGSEILNDNAGDDLNMKLFVDSIEQSRMDQGAYHFNVARSAVSLLLGNSQTNTQGGFNGDIAELRLYSGELQLHEVDRILTMLKEKYVSGSPGVVFERPWADAIEVPAGSNLSFRGTLTGGATSASWDVMSGPAPVTFSNANSPNSDVFFEQAGPYHLRITATKGLSSGAKDIYVDVFAPGSESSDATARPVVGNWISSEIGSSATNGAYTEAGAQISVTGSGVGLGSEEGETYDHGHFVWKGVSGDFDWVARLNSLSNQNGPTRAGIMLRGGAGPTDAAAFIGYAPDGKVYALFRQDGGYWGDLTVEASPSASLPAYLKLERRGALVSASISADGTAYTQIASSAVQFPGVVRSGFFVTSGDSANTITAVFDNFSLEQIGYAGASTVQLASNNSTGSLIEYDPQLIGADEPWLSAIQESGPEEVSFYSDDNGHRHVLRANPETSGAYRTRLAVDDGNMITFVSKEDTIVFNNRYDFDSDGDTEGWSSANIDNFAAASGRLAGTASTSDPQLTQSGVSLNGVAYTQVAVRMQSSLNGPVQLFWGREGASGFSASRLLTLDYSGNGAMQTLTFNMDGVSEWDGETITALRIDPVNGASASGATFEVDFIEISDGLPLPESRIAADFDLNGDFAGWTIAKHLEGAYVLGGNLHATSNGADPIMTKEVDAVNADAFEAVLVRIKSTQAGILQLFWASTEFPAYAGTRSVSTAVSGSGDWQTLRLPLGGNPEWDGKTITNLRLDPINQSNADIQIDAIVLSSGDADQDTLPDIYEAANGLDALLSTDAVEDLDKDGFSSLDEFIAGTDPDDAGDRFEVTQEIYSSSAFAAQVDGKTGRTYRLERKLSLDALNWTLVETQGPLATDGTITLTDSSVFDHAFYRVVVSN